MSKYGKKAQVLAIVLIVLAVIPALTAIICLPQMPEVVPMKFDAAGEVVRSSTRFEMLIVPALSTLLCLATYMSAGKQARAHEKESETMARLTAERFLRNGVVTGVVLNLANAYLMYVAMTGTGMGF